MSRIDLGRATLLVLMVCLISTWAAGQTVPPRIFLTDLPSGPNTGGESVSGFAGAYVTIYGNNFGSTQGTSSVTLNGANCLRVVSWGQPWLWYQKIVVQLGSSCTTGNFAVTTSVGTSNAAAFAVRSGSIHCVSTTGNDSATGSFPNCWKTPTFAKASTKCGDILYMRQGILQNALDNTGAAFDLREITCPSSNPISFVGYPGEKATIGTANGGYTYATRTDDSSYLILAELTFVGPTESVEVNGVMGSSASTADHQSYVGNDISCPNGSGENGCMHFSIATNTTVLSNYVHDVGTTAGSIDKYFHAVYFTTNSNGGIVGWNEIFPNTTHSTTSGGCRAFQIYSTGGSDVSNFHIHDNYIHDSICDGINLASVNPNNGIVEVYNNVVWHAGTGPDPFDGSSNYACIATVAQTSNPTVPVQIYNNTLYDCGSRGTNDSGAIDAWIPTQLTNNIVVQKSGEFYLKPNANNSNPGGKLSGSKNEWSGLGNGPSQTTSNVNADPLFVSTATQNFHLQAGSPAIDTGVAVSLATDHDGVPRPQGAGFDIGAYEFGSGGSTQPKPNPPTNVTVTVQ